MKYHVTRTCGHEERIELFGKNSAREYKLAEAAKELCTECRAAQRQKAEKHNMELAEANGLVTLEGSEKQVAWATTIRQNHIDQFAAWEEADYDAIEYLDGISKDEAHKLFNKALQNKSARFWINNRSNVFEVFEALTKER